MLHMLHISRGYTNPFAQAPRLGLLHEPRGREGEARIAMRKWDFSGEFSITWS